MKYIPLLMLTFVVGEIVALIFVGQRLGILLTLLLLFAGLVGGIALIRSTGLVVSRVMGSQPRSAKEANELAGSATYRLVAGLLFMVPGFLTDIMAVLLLLPPVQKQLSSRMSARFSGFRAEWTSKSGRHGPVIDGEAVEIEGEITSEPGRPE